MNKATEIISQVMIQNGFRHKYQVAEYFGVTPQAISTWLTKGEVPSKHLLKVRSEIESPNLPDHQEPTIEDRKTVIDYLINENVRLKKQVSDLKLKLNQTKNDDDLISRLNSRSLVLKGRVSDGVITDIEGDWYNIMGYHKSDLVGHSYDEGFIHEEDSLKIRQNQENILRSTGLKESRFSTIRRWKHKDTNQYIMLCMIWYVDIENDEVEIIAKPIDENLQDSLFAN
ncbi:MAG: PAS domain S-box protein [Candidatus Neomarinimicrobiota bacterium]|nr:PAS domain S-box protein [Candidatus Neomarinimicrobiota bacterium]MEC9437116.1 PAS domain S-box protein [Candidatus Neomarinimicrobiota bacterium]|tara:strand:+ start:911 stop:1594 length:684 start_codon:yes stop_codon:yes gene_type:complete